MKYKQSQEKGFSLLELLLVIGVGALLLLAGLATYRIVTQGNNVSSAVRLLNSSKIGIQTLYQNQSTYGSTGADLSVIAAQAGVFPARNVIDSATGQIRDPWGNDIVLEVGAADAATFVITLVNLPQEACVQLGTAFTPSSDSDFLDVTIQGDVYADPTVADAQSSCEAGATNTVAWTFI
jgi:prepilin-type N-terminal cleavage/methylation domain-containing protein